MHNDLSPEPKSKARQTSPDRVTDSSPAGIVDDAVVLRRLAKASGWTHHERLRIVWYRLRLTVQEMNYATRRLAELQMRLP